MEPCTAPDREMHNDDHALHVKEVEAQNTRFVLIRNGMNAFVENESVIGPVVVESLAVQSECFVIGLPAGNEQRLRGWRCTTDKDSA